MIILKNIQIKRPFELVANARFSLIPCFVRNQFVAFLPIPFRLDQLML